MSKKATKNTNRSQKNGRTSQNNNSSGNKSTSSAGNGSQQARGKSQPKVAGLSRSQKVTVTQAPIQTFSNGSTRIVHRELIGPVVSNNNTFQLLKRLRINAASHGTFPWLSTIANAYETYKFHRLRFDYISRSPATSSGSLMIVPDYDASDRALVSEQEASQNVDTVEDNIWVSITCRVDPQKMNRAYKSHFCMSDLRFSTTSQDQKTLDAAQVSVICDSSTVGTIGKLWVEYDVTLGTPQLAELAPNLGGAGTKKVTGFAANSANLFTSDVMQANFQEPENPILSLYDVFPSPHLFKVNRDWEGFIDTAVETSAAMTNFPAPVINGQTISSVPGWTNTITALFNGANTNRRDQWQGSLKIGDLVGFGQVATTGVVNALTMNLGGSSVI